MWLRPWEVAERLETEFAFVDVSEEAGQMRADESIDEFRMLLKRSEQESSPEMESELREAWRGALSIAVVVDAEATLWFRTTASFEKPLELMFQPHSPEDKQKTVARRVGEALGYSIQAIDVS